MKLRDNPIIPERCLAVSGSLRRGGRLFVFPERRKELRNFVGGGLQILSGTGLA
jgi:hypothetical protein